MDIARLESELAWIRSEIAEMKRREELAVAEREMRCDRIIDGILTVLLTVLLVAAWAHGFK